MATITPTKTKKLDNDLKIFIYTVEKAEERTKLLIANFEEDHSDGLLYAVGWKFKLPSAFRAALDIKYSAITIAGKSVKVWTQGIEYAFDVGDLIHSADGHYSVQVDRATPCKCGLIEVKIDSEQPEYIDMVQKKRNDGMIRFQIFNGNTSSKFIDCTQVEFVRLLMTGKLMPLKHDKDIDFFTLDL